LLVGLVLILPPAGVSADKDDGFRPLFNDKDLSGWVRVNCHPDTFFARGSELITTGKPTGYLRTDRQYENFVADFEWMHVNKTEVGNSGFFVWGDALPGVGSQYTRGIEVQVLVNLTKDGYGTSHGDLFSIQGATCIPDHPHPHGWARCLPSEYRCKGGGEWNHYTVIANNGAIKLEVNGKEVSGIHACSPRKGYLALESEGAECHFRHMKIKELPSTNPKPEETAAVATGFMSLYTGMDLAGWKVQPGQETHWQPRDYVLSYDGKSEAKVEQLWSAGEHADLEIMADCRIVTKQGQPAEGEAGLEVHGLAIKMSAEGTLSVRSEPRSAESSNTLSSTAKEMKPAGSWNRLLVRVKSGLATVSVNDKVVFKDLRARPGKGPVALLASGPVEFCNIFALEK
jgi:hypothetical protein